MTTGPEELEQLLLLSKPLFEASEHKHGGRLCDFVRPWLLCGHLTHLFIFASAKLTFQLFFFLFSSVYMCTQPGVFIPLPFLPNRPRPHVALAQTSFMLHPGRAPLADPPRGLGSSRKWLTECL